MDLLLTNRRNVSCRHLHYRGKEEHRPLEQTKKQTGEYPGLQINIKRLLEMLCNSESDFHHPCE